MLAAVRERGPVRSADFAREDGKSGGWWEWKPEKRALEMLFTAGELMIARRQNFQRLYDLRERVLPSWDDARLPPRDETRRALVHKAVRALGVATARWAGDYFRTGRKETASLVTQRWQRGRVAPRPRRGCARKPTAPDNRSCSRRPRGELARS